MDLVLGSDVEAGVVEGDKGLASDGNEGVETHLAEELDDEVAREGEAGARVDVGRAGDEGAGSEVGSVDGTGSTGRGSRVDDADGLDTEGTSR